MFTNVIEKDIRKKKAQLAANKEEMEVLALVAERLQRELRELRVQLIKDKALLSRQSWRYDDGSLVLCYDEVQELPAALEYQDGHYEIEKGVTLILSGSKTFLIFEGGEEVIFRFVKENQMDVNYNSVLNEYLTARQKYNATAAIAKKLGVTPDGNT